MPPIDGCHDRGPRDPKPQLELLRTGSTQLQRRAGRLVGHLGGDKPVRVDGQEHHGHVQCSVDGEGRDLQDQDRRHQLGSDELHRRSRSRSVRCRSPTSIISMSRSSGCTSLGSPAAARRPVLPEGQGHPRPDGHVPGPCARTLPAATDYFDDDDGKTGEGSINALAKSRITGGCGPRRFCPTASVTRAQMAMFLDRALALPNATTDYFDDDDGKTGEGSINALAKSAITGGCGPRRYCPTSRSRANRWPPSCTAPTCRAASTEERPGHALAVRPQVRLMHS